MRRQTVFCGWFSIFLYVLWQVVSVAAINNTVSPEWLETFEQNLVWRRRTSFYTTRFAHYYFR